MDDNGYKFLCCDSRNGDQILVRPGAGSVSADSHLPMNAELVKAASEVITNQQILVNMVSRRVRQLCLGHRPLVEYAPGLGHADIALTEIANGKLGYESTFGQNGKEAPAQVVQFPGIIVNKKAKKAA
jgi:DNA-directed RNA polymerase subunit K/omega